MSGRRLDTKVRFVIKKVIRHYSKAGNISNLTEVIKMKVAVICAIGKEGRLIVKEALDRGLDVTAE